MNKNLLLLSLLLTFFLITGCVQKDLTKEEVKQMGKLRLTSPAFENNENIPDKYTCNGDDVNPPLSIEGIPENTKSLVLIVDDPDAPMGTWDHWIVWNIPVVSKIEEDSVPKGAIQGLSDFKKHNYGGPCPPSGTHRYMFKLYALDTILNLNENSKKENVEKAMQGHILARTKLVGLYSKK